MTYLRQGQIWLELLTVLIRGPDVRKAFEPRHEMRKPTFWFPTRSDTNQAVQLQKMARGLKFRILKVEGLYYLCSENKGADQLHGYREANLRLCFRICKMLVFT